MHRKNIDTSNKYQQETINTIQAISNNYVKLQNNILNTYQSTFSRFLDMYLNQIGITLDFQKDILRYIIKLTKILQITP